MSDQYIYGWKIRVTDKTVTFTMPDMKRGIRGNKLGDGYGKAELMERIDVAIKEKAVAKAKRIAEEKAREEAGRIAEAKLRRRLKHEKMPESKQNEKRRLTEQNRRGRKNCLRKRGNWHLNEIVFNLSILWQILILRVGILSMRSI